MSQINYKNGDLITAANILDNTLVFSNTYKRFGKKITANIKIINATGIRFSSGDAITVNGYKWITGESFSISFILGGSTTELHFQANVIGESFAITI